MIAEFLGYGVTSDAFHMTAPDPSGVAGGRTIRTALLEWGPAIIVVAVVSGVAALAH